ncbi:GNAT family N-acetyltransferase [Kitasatospora acidiphila]|uniref:GNAT family N-acetyltransferase n=1 Tax=Kitasatospora acidiphila TaxID=2567942 RepID=A0A540W031_9ACTN|nr:GNAT family protein [Kitasatospora acidiphila]TQF02379.1 GNAT family N-acetyltransferase [Kitasatospora acidiphila]
MSDDHEDTDFATDFSVKPTLTGELVILRPFELERDAPVIREWLTDPEVLRFTDGSLDTPPPWDEEAERTMREWYGTRADQPDRLDLAIVDRATGHCVGEAVLNQWHPANRSCSFRILLTAAGRDRGLGTEALRLIVGYGFERLGLHRISLTVYGHNPRGRRSYEKAGFVLEGTRRQVLHFGEEWVDDHDMAILAPEWARHRGYPELA